MNPRLLSIIIGMAIATFITRIGSQMLFANTGMPPWMERWLKHVPTAFLTALVVPALIMPEGYIDLTLKNSYLLAGVLAAFTAYKTRNVLITILIGMTAVIVLNRLIIL